MNTEKNLYRASLPVPEMPENADPRLHTLKTTALFGGRVILMVRFIKLVVVPIHHTPALPSDSGGLVKGGGPVWKNGDGPNRTCLLSAFRSTLLNSWELESLEVVGGKRSRGILYSSADVGHSVLELPDYHCGKGTKSRIITGDKHPGNIGSFERLANITRTRQLAF